MSWTSRGRVKRVGLTCCVGTTTTFGDAVQGFFARCVFVYVRVVSREFSLRELFAYLLCIVANIVGRVSISIAAKVHCEARSVLYDLAGLS